ncbi:hypothetical protein GALMADRAFT_256229 [Galerina marginata CBS 339.88]|uniref:Nephrocystin 3-like N-terminal domain-containing protein n=1 Tax=Galerina marginata (strain CBS 339.88) TaxID=685588 RepID=A0A067SQG1_GALM3|nr:hypothetical protein GALMADRAFT_256229 [Galerina marginata CBS 339.88]
MLSRSQNVITGGTFTQVNNSGKGGYERLENATAPAAFHDSAERGDPPKCHPNTRVAVTEKIMSWILGLDPETRNALIMWIYGPAGSGKTAIAQTIAERCAEEGYLLASFFFFRSDPTRNHPRSFIPTIAYQMAVHLPSFRERVVETINTDPHIFNRSMAKQIVGLIIEPLQHLLSLGFFNESDSRRLIIVDGLDECEDHSGQLEILRTISDSFQRHHLPLIFLIASRPEYDISNAFGAGYLQETTARLALDSEYQASDDIKLFLRDEFVHIKENHPLKSRIPDDWPTEEVLDKLMNKSSGQFIYAATVTKFVKSTRHRPPNRLDIILGLNPAASARDMPFAELDALYRHIFLSVQDLDTALLILVWDMISRKSRSSAGGWTVNWIEKIFSLSRGEIRLLFCDLLSIIDITKEGDEWEWLHYFHASLEDFLFDKSRSKELYLDAPQRSADFSCTLFQYFPKIPAMDIPIGSIYEALETFLKSALPTVELRHEILNFNITHYFCSDFGHQVFWYLPEFLDSVKGSEFIDAPAMTANQIQLFERYAIKQLEVYYSDPRLLLAIAVVGSGVVCPPDAHDSRWMDGKGIHHLFSIDRELQNIDQNGLLCLPLESATLGITQSYYFDFLQSFLNDKTRSGVQALDGVKYGSAALYALRYICDHSPKYQQVVARYANRHTSAFKDTPRKWRHAKKWAKVVSQRISKRYDLCRSFKARRNFYSNLPKVTKFHTDWVRSLCQDPLGSAAKFGLDCLPALLTRAGRLEELIQFASRRSFGPISSMFQQESKTARRAIADYLKRMESDNA